MSLLLLFQTPSETPAPVPGGGWAGVLRRAEMDRIERERRAAARLTRIRADDNDLITLL